jgi:5-aminolevulinate synthase
MDSLESLLKKEKSPKKIIAVESMYSIDGSITPFNDLLYLSKKYNALTFVDEIHAVGVHGKRGAGITEMLNIQDKIDIIMGGFGKGYGLVGGYLSGCRDLIDSIRLCGSGFIFTTSLPPHIVLGIMKSIDYNIENIKENQDKRNEVIRYFKGQALDKNIPLIENNFQESQIQSIHIGCPLKSKKIHNLLLEHHNHYVQHLNFPTVSKGNERLRLSLKSFHNKKMINDLLTKIEILLHTI